MAVLIDLRWLCPGRKVKVVYTPPADAMSDQFQIGATSHADRQAVRSSKESKDIVAGSETARQIVEAQSFPREASGGEKKQFKTSCHRLAGDDQATELIETKAGVSAGGEEGQDVCNGKRAALGSTSALSGLPKYTALVVDAAPLSNGETFKHLCAVFIIPQGMELDWLVSTPEGQAEVVAGADSARVFLVTLNRGHLFGSAKIVQGELSPWIRKLVPTEGIAAALQPGPIPYTTPPQGIGHRTVLTESWSEINGAIIIEDVTLAEPGKAEPTTFRRMVFLDTPSLIQSEAVLINTAEEQTGKIESNATKAGDAPEEPLDSKTASKKDVPSVKDIKASFESRKKNPERAREDRTAPNQRLARASSKEPSFGVSPLLEHTANTKKRKRGQDATTDRSFEAHASREGGGDFVGGQMDPPSNPQNVRLRDGLVDPETRQTRPRSEEPPSSRVDFSYLASEYLQAMVAGLAMLGSTLEECELHGKSLEAPNLNASPTEDPNGKGQTLESHKESEKTSEGLSKNTESVDRNSESRGVSKRDRERGEFTNDSGQCAKSCNEIGGHEKSGCPEKDRNNSEEHLKSSNKRGKLLVVLVIGLGGGGLPMFLRHHLPCRVQVVEIDPVVVQLAKLYFGVLEDAALQIHVADAVQWVHTAREPSSSNPVRASYDAVLIDVEAAGGQCPPAAFLDCAFLESLRQLLRPEGVLAMNVVAPKAKRETVYDAVHRSFGGRLHEWSVPRDNNHVVFARRLPEAQAHPSRPSALRTSQILPGVRLDGQDASNKELVASAKPSAPGWKDSDGEETLSESGVECDLVYWASRLAELGAKTTPWGQGPDLPGLAASIRPFRWTSC